MPKPKFLDTHTSQMHLRAWEFRFSITIIHIHIMYAMKWNGYVHSVYYTLTHMEMILVVWSFAVHRRARSLESILWSNDENFIIAWLGWSKGKHNSNIKKSLLEPKSFSPPLSTLFGYFAHPIRSNSCICNFVRIRMLRNHVTRAKTNFCVHFPAGIIAEMNNI